MARGGAVVGPGCVIGDDCVLHSGVTIYESCTLGHRVIIHAGTAIGQDGFGYATHRKAGEELKHHKIPQAGIVVIEDDVELGANCAVERATIGITRIAQGSKIGDSVTIGHGTVIGRHNLLRRRVTRNQQPPSPPPWPPPRSERGSNGRAPR